jgi:hypothetical protein
LDFRILIQILKILKIPENSEQILNITENSEQILNIAENSEQILNIAENSEQILNITENSEQCSESFQNLFRIFRHFSEYLAQKLVYSESLDFVVLNKVQ